MNLVVMKFGGTSVGNVEKIQNVANIVEKESKFNKIIVVLSAMSGATNNLQSYLDKIDSKPSVESDLVLTSGEQVTVGILSIILKNKGIRALPLLGWQLPIITDDIHEKAKILKIDTNNIKNYFKSNDVIVLAGFQGVSTDGFITSLGRGGSDTTAVAIASAISADRCDIYTDVEGVYSADPNIEPKAKKIDKVSFEEMLEMSSTGAKVLHTRSVELAMKNNLRLQVLSSITKKEGTFVLDENDIIEKEIVSGVSHSKNESKITISGILDKPGISAKIFGLMSENNINVDMIVQNISQDGVLANITYTVATKDLNFAMLILEKNLKILNYKSIDANEKVSKVSVIGMGMMSQSGVAEKMFKTLANNSINILAISTSEIKISVLIDEKYTNLAVKSLHEVYKL
ncbi:MAG: aspartate kinase [Pelagibacteraceae bacterium]|nr:aspartate kinase [Pelagibacteraceae bacterium]|tara:strand:- start:7397 stop:8602 length:1206 start_codon:yes stop_codon:yes gene_type:complete